MNRNFSSLPNPSSFLAGTLAFCMFPSVALAFTSRECIRSWPVEPVGIVNSELVSDRVLSLKELFHHGLVYNGDAG
jgi:hypothetical protein